MIDCTCLLVLLSGPEVQRSVESVRQHRGAVGTHLAAVEAQRVAADLADAHLEWAETSGGLC